MGTVLFITIAKGNIKYLKYCTKLYHISQFYNKMLYRKADIIANAMKYKEIDEKYDKLSQFYKNVEFTKISKHYGDLIVKVNKFKDTVDENNYQYVYNNYHYFSRYFDLNNVQPDVQTKKISEYLDELLLLQEINSDVIKYINVPHYKETEISKTLVDLLSKVMVF